MVGRIPHVPHVRPSEDREEDRHAFCEDVRLEVYVCWRGDSGRRFRCPPAAAEGINSTFLDGVSFPAVKENDLLLFQFPQHVGGDAVTSSMVEQPAMANCAVPRSGYGLPTLLALVVTGMIGSGVFTTSGFALEALGSPVAVLAAWAVGGLIACCGALAYAALAFRLPQSGGEYLYLSRSLHPFFGFLAGMVSLSAGFSGAIAYAALTCQAYAQPLVALPAWLPSQTVATVVVLVCGLMHLEAGRLAARLNTAVVAVKMLASLGLVGWGYAALGSQSPVVAGVSEGGTATVGSFAMTVMWIMFSYTGFNEAVYIASEAHSPRRTVPLAVLLGTLAVTTIYLLLNDVMLRSAPAGDLAGQPEVAAVAAAALGGEVFAWWLRLAIVLSTLSAVAGMTMAGSRVVVAMADDGILPRWLAGQAGRSRAVLLQAGIALLLIHLATIRDLLGGLGVTLSLCSALTVATLWMPRRSSAAAVLPLTLPVRLASAVYVAATVIFAVLMCLHDPWQVAGTVAIVIVTTVMWNVRSSGLRPQS